MFRRGPGRLRQLLGAACLATLLPALIPPGSALAAPSPAGAARPTADPAAPTPTTPAAGGPPAGTAPDGSTVGGSRLRTRGQVVADGTPPLPDGIGAAGWLVADLDTGTVLGARDPHGRYYPASTLKTLTLLTLAHSVPWDEVVEATADDEQIDGSRVGLVAGGRYPVALLFQALVMQSGNDAANALARAAGGVPATVAAMNATAERLGAFDTVAGTPSGLDVAGQSSSPYDLALVFRALMDDPLTAGVFQVRTAQMPPVPSRNAPGFQIQSQNPLLDDYPGDLGAKNGFTDAARYTFVTAAQRAGRRLVVTLMQDELRPVDTPTQATRLLDWGFAVPAGKPGVGRLVRPGEVPGWDAGAGSAATRPSPSAAPAAAGPRHGAHASAPGPVAIDVLVVVAVLVALALAASAALALRRARRRPAPD